jgi:formate-dependent nitrite reductase membrane component NrfD
LRPYLQEEWGLRVALDFCLGGAGAGLMGTCVVAGFIYGESGAYVAPLLIGLALLVAGLLVLLADLGRPGNFWRTVKGYRTSWMARGTIANAALLGSSVLLVLALAKRIMALVPPAAIATLVFAAIVVSYPGLLMYSVRDIGLWRSPLLPTLMLSYSIVSGLGLFQLIDLVSSARAGAFVPQMIWAVMVLIAVLNVVFLKQSASSSQGGREGYKLLTEGKLTTLFVLGVVVMGVALTFLCETGVILARGSAPALAVTGSVSCLVGAFLFRYLVLKAAFHEPISVFRANPRKAG